MRVCVRAHARDEGFHFEVLQFFCRFTQMRDSKEYRKWLKAQAKLNRETLTVPEQKVKEWLDEHGLKYRTQVPIVCKKNDCAYIADFVLYDTPVRRCILEIDGKHHQDDSVKLKDSVRTKRLEKKGYFVERIENCLTKDEVVLNNIMVDTIYKLKAKREEEFVKKLTI